MNIRSSRFLMRLALALSLVSVLALGTVGRAAAATVIYVDYSATGLNNGTSWTDAYKSLQKALSVAVSGQQIWVAMGTYKPTTSTSRAISFVLKNGVAVYGGFAGGETLLSQRNVALNVTILSGEIGAAGNSDNSYHVVKGGGTNNTAILDGFTITSGNANGASSDSDGGGVLDSSGDSPTLRNLIISANSAGEGGGMFNSNSASPKLSAVTFSGNSTTGQGGGMMNALFSSPTLTNVTFVGNQSTGEGGGGMYNDAVSSPQLTNVLFSKNSATMLPGAVAAAQGGGMYNFEGSNPILLRVTFSGNSATYGGGMFNGSSSPALTDVSFAGNSATVGGGGMYNGNGNPTVTRATFSGNSASGSGASSEGGGMANDSASPTLTNVTFAKNSTSGYGGGMWNSSSSAHLKNVTFSQNSATTWGGGMYDDNSSNPTVVDSIFWGDTNSEVINTISAAIFTDSDVQGGCPAKTTCTHVVNANPVLGPLQFNGGALKTMTTMWLGSGSAAIDSGGFSAACASLDERGVSRPQGLRCDMGAYEVKVLRYLSVGALDGTLLESAAGSGLGGSASNTGSIFLGDSAVNAQYRGLLSFDTSGVPDGANIVLGRLRILQSDLVGTNPFTTDGALVIDLAKPYFGSSLDLSPEDFQAAPTVGPAGSIGATPSGGWYTGKLTAAGYGAVNKTGTTQLRLRFSLATDGNSASDYMTFYSGDTSTASYRPALLVYYNP